MPKNEENLTEETTAEAMDEVTVDAAEMPDAPDFDPDEWERKRREAEEAELAGARAAAKQRKESTSKSCLSDNFRKEKQRIRRAKSVNTTQGNYKLRVRR